MGLSTVRWTATPHLCTVGPGLGWWASVISASPSSFVLPSDNSPRFSTGDPPAHHSHFVWGLPPPLRPGDGHVVPPWVFSIIPTPLATAIGFEKQIGPVRVILGILWSLLGKRERYINFDDII